MKRFYLKQKVFAITDRYKVFDENQKIVYHCDSRFLSLSHTMELKNTATGKLLYTLKRQIISFLPKYRVFDPSGKEVALIIKKISFFKHKIEIRSDFGEFQLDGNVWAHRFSIISNGQTVVDFSKKWISWGDSYEITIYPEEHVDFFIAMVLMIDDCLHDGKNHHDNANIIING